MLKLSSLNSKIILLLTITLSVIFIFLALITLNQDVITIKNRITDQAASFASLSKEKYIQYYSLYYESGFFKFSELISELNRLNKDLSGVQMYSTNGTLLFDSEEISKGKNSIPNQVVTDEKLFQKLQQPENLSSEITKKNTKYLEIVEPIIDEWGRHDYTIIYYFNFQSLTNNINSAIFRTIIIFLFFYIIAIIPFILLSNKYIVRPIEKLLEGVEIIQGGNLDFYITETSYDEIGMLTAGFNKMVVNLKKSKDEIDDYNKNLEQKIVERTTALNSKVEDIEKLNSVMVGRELAMIEMKKKMQDLENKLKQENKKNNTV